MNTSYDQDGCNATVKRTIFSEMPVWILCGETANAVPHVRNKSARALYGFNVGVMLTYGPMYTLIERVQHDALLAALASLGVIVHKPNYVINQVKPPPFGRLPVQVSGIDLQRACSLARIEVLRLIMIGCKQPLQG